MAWDKFHKVIGANGQVTMTPGYYSEGPIDLPNWASVNTDIVTSHIPFPVKSDFTILIVITDATGPADIVADTYLQVEHSVDNVLWVQRGDIERDDSVATDDISKNMAKIGVIDDSVFGSSAGTGNESEGMMFLYAVDTHGMAPYTRFALKDNGGDEAGAGNKVTFYIIPHF